MQNMIKQLSVFKNNSVGKYCGIPKQYFPKWKGWELLESGASYSEIEEEVVNFYKAFFYYQMRLDCLTNPIVQYAVLNFATTHGKKKALQKLQKVIGIGSTGVELMERFNRLGKEGEYHLLLEFFEFYSFTGDTDTEWLIKTYRSL